MNPIEHIAADLRTLRPSRRLILWSRAAALGSLWAAFEIVVGSFLHNLRVPFAGTLMATASVLLLTAAAQVWDVRGLIWRAALVCALMKSISPSAVILGPMIGIFAEGVILQVVLNLLGRGALACAIGGALAVSYTLFHKIVALTILYGADLVRVFAGIVQFAAKVTGWQSLQPGNVILALVLIQSALGATAGLVGWLLGKQVQGRAQPALEEPKPLSPPVTRDSDVVRFNHSLAMLAVLLVTLPLGLWLLGNVALPWATAMVAIASAGVFWRYRQVARRLTNLRLWAELLIIVLLSGVVLGAARGDVVSGFTGGGRMALRALWVLLLFGAIGVELAHPWLFRLLSRGRMAIVHAAVQSAFRALPAFLASIPDLHQAWREPASTLARLFHLVDHWQQRFTSRRLVILTGQRGTGKTTLCLALAEWARQQGWKVGGIVSLSEGEQRERYRVRDLLSRDESLLAQQGATGEVKVGNFSFTMEGVELGRRALERALAEDVDLLIVDEVGPLELKGGGWAPLLDRLHTRTRGITIWVVRPELVAEVQRRYPLFAEGMVVEADWVEEASELARRLFSAG